MRANPYHTAQVIKRSPTLLTTRSGHGLYLYTSGNRYKGQYRAGRKVAPSLPLVQEGFGQFWWTVGRHAGEKYVGGFVAEKREGQGSYYFRNGDVFTGGKGNGGGSCLLVLCCWFKLYFQEDGGEVCSRAMATRLLPNHCLNFTLGIHLTVFIQTFTNGNLLEGLWEEGKRHGGFIFTFPNGER